MRQDEIERLDFLTGKDVISHGDDILYDIISIVINCKEKSSFFFRKVFGSLSLRIPAKY